MEDEGRTLGRGRDGGTHVDIVAKGHITSGMKERSTLQATRGPIVQGNAAQETGRGLIGPTAGGDSIAPTLETSFFPGCRAAGGGGMRL